jgi:hypothetical protein
MEAGMVAITPIITRIDFQTTRTLLETDKSEVIFLLGAERLLGER